MGNNNTATATDRHDEAAREFGVFPELDDIENHMILIARSKGFARFWPAYPSALSQAKSTFKGAQEWLQAAPENCGDCRQGVAHEHKATNTPLRRYRLARNGREVFAALTFKI